MKKISIIIITWVVMMNGCAKDEPGGFSNEDIADYSKDNYTVNGDVPYNYTINKDLSGFDKTAVLYYFHSSEGDENTWYSSNKAIINEWRKTGKPSPVVVGITFGNRWQLFPKNPEKKRADILNCL